MNDDELVGFLRDADPGEPPVALGPGSALRHRAAARHARRQAVGAALAVALIAIAVSGSIIGTRHHRAATTASRPPLASPSLTTTADQSSVPSRAATASTLSTASFTFSGPTARATVVDSDRPSTQSASVTVPTIESAAFRDPGRVTVGQAVYFTVHYVAHGSVAPVWSRVDYGDMSSVENGTACVTTSPAPAAAGSSELPGEVSTPSHTYMTPGTYTVRVTVSFGCISGAQDTVVADRIVVTGPPATASPSPSAVATSPSPSASAVPSAPASSSPAP